MISSGLFSLFLCLLSLSVSSLFLLQIPCHLSLKPATLFTPAVICKTFLCKFNIQTSNICRHRPSPYSTTHLLSLLCPLSKGPHTSLKSNVSPNISAYNICSLLTKNHLVLTRNDSPICYHRLKLLSVLTPLIL